MRTKLTDIKIRSLKPHPQRRTEIPDGNGLYLITQPLPSGAKSFALRFRREGRPAKLTLGPLFAGDIENAPEPKIGGPLTLKGARVLAAQTMLAIGKGHDPGTAKRHAREASERRRKDTFKNIAEQYMKREAGMRTDADGNPTGFDETKLRTGAERWLMLQRSIFPALGSRPIAEIKKSDIINLLDQIADGEAKDGRGRKIKGGNVAADRALAVIRKVFNWYAIRSDDDFRSPVVAGLNRVKTSDHSRERVLNDEELRVIWKVADESGTPFAAMVKFLLLTASRRAEAAKMTWSEIDLAQADWTLPASRNKVKKDLVRPLSLAAQALLGARPRIIGSKLVFTNDGTRPLTGYAKAKKKFDAAVLAKLREHAPKTDPLPNWTLHDLRRTARSLMSRAGISPEIAEQCLGHLLPGIQRIYNRHLFYDEKKKAFEAVAALIERIVRPQTDNVLPFQQSVSEKL